MDRSAGIGTQIEFRITIPVPECPCRSTHISAIYERQSAAPRAGWPHRLAFRRKHITSASRHVIAEIDRKAGLASFWVAASPEALAGARQPSSSA